MESQYIRSRNKILAGYGFELGPVDVYPTLINRITWPNASHGKAVAIALITEQVFPNYWVRGIGQAQAHK